MQRPEAYEHAAKDNLAPLLISELSRVIQDIPMAFVKAGDNFQFVGLMSLTPGQNLYVHADGSWAGEYVPSCFKGYPFKLARAQDRLVLCVDESSGLISDTDGQPFYDEMEELDQSVKDILNYLSKIEKSRNAANNVVSSLAEAGVIEQWNLRARSEEGNRNISGLYTVDETKLNSLDDQSFLELRKAGALPLAYAQILSRVNVKVIEKLN